MRTLFLIFLVLGLSAPTARAASFDCSAATTLVELAICGNGELSELDSELGRTYSAVLARSSDPVDLRAVQRAWLNDVRNLCTDLACLQTAYRQRLADLRRIDWMTDERAEAICSEVTDAINDGSIEGRVVKFDRPSAELEEAWLDSSTERGFRSMLGAVASVDYDRDGDAETLGRINSHGTCATSLVVDLAPTAPLRQVWPDEHHDRLRRAGWGGSDHLLFVDGEPIMVKGNVRRSGAYSLVSWLAPDGAKRVLCELGRTDGLIVEVARQEEPALCEAVIDDRIDVLEWADAPSVQRQALNAAGLRPDFVFETRIDVDRDGIDELFARVDYASGAGCGDNVQWLVELDPSTRLPIESESNDWLTDRRLGVMDNHREPERWTSIQMLRFEGNPYFLARGTNGSDAEVYSLRDRGLESLCGFTLIRQHQVERFFPVDSWPDDTE